LITNSIIHAESVAFAAASPAADKDRDSWLALLLQSIGSGECLWEQLEMDLRLLQCLLNADQDSIIREFRQLNGYEKLCSAIERLRTPPTSPINAGNNQHTAKAQQQKLIPMIMAIIQDSKICQQLLPFIDEQMPRKDFYSAALQTQLEQLTIADDLKGEMDETQLTEADKQLLDGFCAEITGVTAVKNNTENNEGVKSLKKFKFDDCDNNRFEFPPTEPQQILMRSMDSALYDIIIIVLYCNNN
jgi:hypothetical protein